MVGARWAVVGEKRSRPSGSGGSRIDDEDPFDFAQGRLAEEEDDLGKRRPPEGGGETRSAIRVANRRPESCFIPPVRFTSLARLREPKGLWKGVWGEPFSSRKVPTSFSLHFAGMLPVEESLEAATTTPLADCVAGA